jgi:Skp family chaperone for outer membrane proteins
MQTVAIATHISKIHKEFTEIKTELKDNIERCENEKSNTQTEMDGIMKNFQQFSQNFQSKKYQRTTTNLSSTFQSMQTN